MATFCRKYGGQVYRAELYQLDDDGYKWACADVIAITNVYSEGVLVSATEYTIQVTEIQTTITFTNLKEYVTVDATGLGGTRIGGVLRTLRTRKITRLQGQTDLYTTNTVVVNRLIDTNTSIVTGGLLRIHHEDGTNETYEVNAFNPETRAVSVTPDFSPRPTSDDIYELSRSVRVGLFDDDGVDQGSFYALNDDIDFDVGLAASDQTAIETQDQLTKPFLIHIAPQRNGLDRAIRLYPADSEPVKTINRIVGGVDAEVLPIVWRIVVEYSDTKGRIRPHVSTIQAAKDAYPQAESRRIQAPISTRGAARELAAHHFACFGLPSRILSFTTVNQIDELNLGDVVTVHHKRVNQGAQVNGVVVYMQDGKTTHQLGVWVHGD